jgi:hypothetical protein
MGGTQSKERGERKVWRIPTKEGVTRKIRSTQWEED